jgi:hypothetical protein
VPTPQNDRVIIQELAWEIAQAKADEHPEKWGKDDDGSDSFMGRTVVTQMNYGGWPADGIPGLIPLILKMLADKEIEAFSTFNELPCTELELVKTNPAKWFISSDDANQIRYAMGLEQFTCRGINSFEMVMRHTYEEKQSEKETRRALGRYTLDEAATFIYQATTGQDAKKILKMLEESAEHRTLATYIPGELIPQERKLIASWYEAYWDELNEWRKVALPRLVCEFPNPNSNAMKQDVEKILIVEKPSTVPTITNKLRRNSLDPVIDKAISIAGSTELAAVYLALKELALAETKPFTGALEGDAMCYTDDENNPDKLTKDALGKRLKRRLTP